MGRMCCVPGCTSARNRSGVKMFSVPRDPIQIERWRKVIPLTNSKKADKMSLTIKHKVCILHFDTKDYQDVDTFIIQGEVVTMNRGVNGLKPNAIPCFNLPIGKDQISFEKIPIKTEMLLDDASVSPVVERCTSPVEECKSPVEGFVSSVDASVLPVEASVSLVEASVSPVEASVSPVEASVSPVEASVSPIVKRSVWPVLEVSGSSVVKASVPPFLKPRLLPVLKPRLLRVLKPSVSPVITATLVPVLKSSVTPVNIRSLLPVVKGSVSPIAAPVIPLSYKNVVNNLRHIKLPSSKWGFHVNKEKQVVAFTCLSETLTINKMITIDGTGIPKVIAYDNRLVTPPTIAKTVVDLINLLVYVDLHTVCEGTLLKPIQYSGKCTGLVKIGKREKKTQCGCCVRRRNSILLKRIKKTEKIKKKKQEISRLNERVKRQSLKIGKLLKKYSEVNGEELHEEIKLLPLSQQQAVIAFFKQQLWKVVKK